MKFLFEYFMDEGDTKLPLSYLISFMDEFERMYVFYEGLNEYLNDDKVENPDFVWLADRDLRVWDELPPQMPNTVDIENTE